MNVALSLLLCVAGAQIPLATEAELPGGQKVLLAADQLLYEPSQQRLQAKGNTMLRTDEVTVRADEVVYDQAAQTAYAKGNVMFVSGLLAGVAEEVRVDIKSLEAEIVGGLFMRKRNVTVEQLLAAKTPQELKRTGETVLSITGTRIKRIAENEFLVDGLSFTPCDCDPTEPSWRVEAKRAQVEMGERAILTWPVIYVYQVPIFAVPWLYVPLSDRRTGLLVPRPTNSALNGFSFEQPFFLTLGESYDMTFTPGYYRGATERDPVSGERVDSPIGIRGPRLHTEFRYQPTPQLGGRATLGLLYDLKDRRNPFHFQREFQLEGQPRGLRGELSWLHVQDMGNGWRNRVDLGAISDGYYLVDITADVLARQAEYLRSTAVVAHRSHGAYFGIDAVVRQPMYAGDAPVGTDLLRNDRDREGNLLRGPRTFARGPALTWTLLDRAITEDGPLRVGGSVELARIGPLNASWGDEGTDGVFRTPPIDPAARDPLQSNGRFEPGEREARERLDLNPRLSAPFGFGRFARVTPYLSLRETLWFSEFTGQTAHRGYALLGTRADTTLVADFPGRHGQGGLRHRITPRADVRWAPFVLRSVELDVPGSPEAQPYDAVDSAIRPDGIFQAVTELRQEFGLWQGDTYRELFRLDLGQGFDLQRQKVADTYAALTLQQGPVSLSGVVRYDLPTRRISQFSGRIHMDNGKGTSLFASYDDLLSVGSDPLRAGIDELVGRPLSTFSGDELARASRARQLHAGFRHLFPFGLGVRYEGFYQPEVEIPWQRLPQQLAALSYGPGCNCWRLEVYAWLRPRGDGARGFLGTHLQNPDVGANLTIHQFGNFGTKG